MNASIRNLVIAGVTTLAVTLWLGLGLLLGKPSEPEPPATRLDSSGREPFRVAIAHREAETIRRHLILHGETQPARSTTLRARTAGVIAAVNYELGAVLNAGNAIVRLAAEDRPTQRQAAEALRAQRLAEFEAAERLGDQGYQSAVERQRARAALEAARAELEAIAQDLARTTIRAPFDGLLEERLVEMGDTVAIGDPVATLVDLDPLTGVIHLAEQDIGAIERGQTARVLLRATGETRTATIRAIAPRAEPGTRTYRVELRIPNPSRTPAGGTIRVELPLERLATHRLSPALLTLDAAGRLGVKTVNAEDRVVFHPITLQRAEPEALWVTGLPETVRLITRGAGFVTAGERVHPERTVEAFAPAASAPEAGRP